MKDLRWHEPAAYRRALANQQGHTNRLGSIKFAAWVVLISLGARGLGGLENRNPNLPGWTSTIVGVAITAVLLAFFMHLVTQFLPSSSVVLSPNGVNNNIIGHGATMYFWPWNDISYCSAAVETFADKRFTTFSVHGVNGQTLATFGLGHKPSIAEITQLLHLHGKTLKEQRGQEPLSFQ